MGFDYIDYLKHHVGHQIVCVAYGHTHDPEDVCIECETCNQVLFSADTLMIEDEDNNFVEPATSYSVYDELEFDYEAAD